MQAYSLDLRERVVAAYETGRTTIGAVAAQFSVGETFVKKMLRQKRQSGSLTRLPRARRGEKGIRAETPPVAGKTNQRAVGRDLARTANGFVGAANSFSEPGDGEP